MGTLNFYDGLGLAAGQYTRNGLVTPSVAVKEEYKSKGKEELEHFSYTNNYI